MAKRAIISVVEENSKNVPNKGEDFIRNGVISKDVLNIEESKEKENGLSVVNIEENIRNIKAILYKEGFILLKILKDISNKKDINVHMDFYIRLVSLKEKRNTVGHCLNGREKSVL